MSDTVEVVPQPLVPGTSPAAPFLATWDARGVQRRWPLQGAVVTVGRASGADVVVADDPLVSRLHSTLERMAGGWTIRDDGLSRNGTFVNGTRVTGRRLLRDRDEIRVGRSTLVFCSPGQADEPRTLAFEPVLSADRLTPAQRDVLRALCRPCWEGRGLAVPATNQQIADELHLSVDAVKTHLRGLFHRLGIDDLPQNAKRARLVEISLQHGLVSRPDA